MESKELEKIDAEIAKLRAEKVKLDAEAELLKLKAENESVRLDLEFERTKAMFFSMYSGLLLKGLALAVALVGALRYIFK